MDVDRIRSERQRWPLAILPDAVVVMDIQGTLLDWNAGAERLYQLSAEDACALGAETALPGEVLTAIREIMEIADPGAPAERTIVHGRNLVGSDATFELILQVAFDASGEPHSAAMVARDISDLERERERADRLAQLLKDSNDAVIVQRLDGSIVAWNRGGEKMYGFPADEAVGRAFEGIVPIDERDAVEELRLQVSQGKHFQPFESHRTRFDGTRLDVSVTATPLLDENGAVWGICTTERDITDLKRHQAELLGISQLATPNSPMQTMSWSASPTWPPTISRNPSARSRPSGNDFKPDFPISSRSRDRTISHACVNPPSA